MILYFYGDNDYGIAQAIKALRQKYVEKVGDSLEYERLDAKEVGLQPVLDMIATVPMFATSRLIVLDNLAAAKPEEIQLQKLVDSADSTTVIVIADPSPDKRSRIYKQLSKLKGAKQYAKLSQPQLTKWLQTQAQQQDSQIDAATASFLVDWAGADQWTLHHELQKLAIVEKITKQQIEQLVSPSVEASGFRMLDALMAPDRTRLLAEYQRLLDDAQTEQQIIGLLNWQLRTLVLAKDGQTRSSNNWTKTFRVAPFVANKARSIVSKLSPRQLSQAYTVIVQADYSIKSRGLASQQVLRQALIDIHNILHQPVVKSSQPSAKIVQ